MKTAGPGQSRVPRPDVTQKSTSEPTSLREGTRVFSAYELLEGTRIWIITEADRSVTTILLPQQLLINVRLNL